MSIYKIYTNTLVNNAKPENMSLFCKCTDAAVQMIHNG